MTSGNRKRFKMLLREDELFGLIFTAMLLILVEGCCVYWLNHMQLADDPVGQSGFLVLPPWHRRPRFEVTLLLTIAAGMIFSVVRGIWGLWRSSDGNLSADVVKRVRQRLSAAASVTAIAGVNLALATWLAR
jgi:hypothetical protein